MLCNSSNLELKNFFLEISACMNKGIHKVAKFKEIKDNSLSFINLRDII